VCGSPARTDLYGGRLAIAVPTVTGTGTLDWYFVKQRLLRVEREFTLSSIDNDCFVSLHAELRAAAHSGNSLMSSGSRRDCTFIW
jgi:hypothetical protein